MEMYSLTGKNQLICMQICEFPDLAGIFPPNFNAIKTTSRFNTASIKKAHPSWQAFVWIYSTNECLNA
jgi:hypothetical protein